MNRDVDAGAGPDKRLVDGIIHNLVYEMMQGFDVRPAHVHARAFANRFQSLQDLNAACIITCIDVLLFRHKNLQDYACLIGLDLSRSIKVCNHWFISR